VLPSISRILWLVGFGFILTLGRGAPLLVLEYFVLLYDNALVNSDLFIYFFL
jgi:hypothetical protein